MAGILGWAGGAFGGGMLGNEYGPSTPYDTLGASEAMAAQEARDAYMRRLQRGNVRQGGYDPSIFDQPSPGQAPVPNFSGPMMQPSTPNMSPAMSAPPAPPAFGAGAQPGQMFGASPFGLQPFDGGGLPPRAAPATGPMPPQAPPIPPQMQPQQSAGLPPMPEPGFGDRLSAGFNGFANSRGLLPAIGNLIGGLSSGQRTDPAGQQQQAQILTTRAIYSALVAKGHNPQEAMGIASAAAQNPQIAQAILPEALGTKKPSGVMKIGDMELPYSIGPGGVAQMHLPGGQGGQGGGPLGSLQQLIDWQQANAAEKARKTASGEAVGKVEGENKAALPTTLEKADEALRTIENIRRHPGREYGTGMLGTIPGIPGTQQRDFVKLVDQAKGQTFLQAFQMLKGAGAITEAEGTKGTEAVGRLDRAQTKEGFETALNDLRDVVKAGRERAGLLAGGQRTPAKPTGLGAGTYNWSPHGGVQ